MSPIPSFDHNHVLPPHLGNAQLPSDLSPYKCSIMNLCVRFATSKERIEILRGLVAFRIKMLNEGILNGFQWLDGSFTEDIESSQHRPPNDLDLVTFYKDLTAVVATSIPTTFPEFVNSSLSKTKYKLDHYIVDYGDNPEITVEGTRYWIQFFSHTRLGVWKGIIHLPLNTTTVEDDNALVYLNTL